MTSEQRGGGEDVDRLVAALAIVMTQAIDVVDRLRRVVDEGNGGVVDGGGVGAGSGRCEGAARSALRQPSRSPPRHSREVRRAVRYIEVHYREGISVTRLAGVAHCNRWRLARAFKRETGATIRSYVMQVRLARAARDVQAGDKIEAAMLGAGFRGKRNFYQQFKARFGMTPAAYRERELEFELLSGQSETLGAASETVFVSRRFVDDARGGAEEVMAASGP